MQLSDYINHTIIDKGESIWIAQRSGRSKDGDDRTNPSLLKMFNLKGRSTEVLENIRSLEICPVSISYEFNPCDALTIPELLQKEKGERYEKQPMEDMIHMGTGIEGQKGKIAVSFGRPLNGILDSMDEIKNRNELLASLAGLIDQEIHRSYQLMPTNYIAYDLLHQSSDFSSNYAADEKQAFINCMEEKIEEVEGEKDLVQRIFLKMYANPVANQVGEE